MIGLIRGKIFIKKLPIVTVDVNGIGYEIHVAENDFYSLPDIGSDILIHTYFVVRENEQLLYGFLNGHQKELFQHLLKVNGVGPKLALAITSGISPKDLLTSLLHKDHSIFLKISGVGKKIAERLVLEMHGRLKELQCDLLNTNLSFSPELPLTENISAEQITVINDAISALVSLGYKFAEARHAILNHKDKKSVTSEELVKLALKEIYANKHG